ncbi:carboxypeptidase B-like [Tubulanus polymorphus]|uniref:carboxypeptidase B-like n=1 Tax=Tubulanus polymorphus TaxID=672921 RepID=UPI003DA6B0BA
MVPSSTILLVAVLFSAAGAAVRYDGYKVVRIQPTSQGQLDYIRGFIKSEQLDEWKMAVGQPGMISIPPKSFEYIVKMLNNRGIKFVVTIDDLQKSLEEQRNTPPGIHRSALSLSQYHSYKEIVSYMESAVMNNLDLPISRFSIGKTVEGRTIEGIKFGKDTAAKAVWIDGGIHAREWISPATLLYTINKVITLYRQKDPFITALLSNVQVYFVPVLNPDGYVYTWTTDRMWRKNRRRGRYCTGVDLNRNWKYHWMEQGASSYECSETYAGPSAMSEPETQAVANFIETNKQRIRMYLSFHSFGQYFLTPWGYGRVLPDDYKQLESLAKNAVGAIRAANGPRYTVGTSAFALYPAAGGSDDWAKGVAGIKYSYTIELPDNGRYGFALPARFIEPTGRHTWHAFVVLLRHVLDN